MGMDEDDKRVAFGDEKKDEGIRKNNSFSGALTDVIGHSDEAYPHYHHVISRHRPSRSRKVIDKGESKLPTIPDTDKTEREEDQEQSEKKDAEKPVKIFSVGQGP